MGIRRPGFSVRTLVVTLFFCACGEKPSPLESTGGGGGSAASSSGSGGDAGNAASGGVSGSSGPGGEGGSGNDGPDGGGTAGSGGTPVGWVPYFGAGTRLLPIVDGVNRVDRFTGEWFDQVLGVSCTFQGPSDDYRCQPSGTGSLLGYWLDATCTDPLVLIPDSACSGASDTFVALGPMGEACQGNVHYRSVGADLEPGELYFGTPETCTSVPASSLPAGFTARAGETIAWSSLARASFVVRERAPGMNAYVLESEDGAWVIEGFHDPERDGPCWPVEELSPSDRCVPHSLSTSQGLFTDEACQSPGAEGSPADACSPHAPRAALRLGNAADTCPPTTEFELDELGEPAAGNGFQRDPDGACTPATAGAGALYSLGSPIALDSLPLLEQGVVAAGRLVLPFHSFGGIPFFPAGEFVEAASGARCRAMLFSDGVSRCVPDGWLGTGDPATEMPLFVDAGCMGDRAYVFHPDPCRPNAEPVGILVRDAACSGRYSGLKTAVRFDGTVYGATFGGPCEAVDSLEGGTVLYAPGDELDPDEEFQTLEHVARGP